MTGDINCAARMPVAFFGHGSPTNVLEDNDATRTWKIMADRIGRPEAILCISAHWLTQGVRVTAMPVPRTIHDFGRSLPGALFDQSYPAPGSLALAQRVKSLLSPVNVALDQEWGLDHGAWSVLSKAYPHADVPVVQLSMDMNRPGAWHYQLAQQLKPLRAEGVLILASGNIVHNLGTLNWSEDAQPYDWAVRFNAFVKEQIVRGNHAALFDVRDQGDDARRAVPSEDHYWPLLYALGSSDAWESTTFLSDYIVYSSLSMTSALIEDYGTER